MLLSGISTEAAKSIDASLHVSVIDNWYFMATSVILLTLVGGLITDKLVEPRLGQWQGCGLRGDEWMTRVWKMPQSC